MEALVAAPLAGILVALTSLLAGRAAPAWAGFVAAAPITPSLAVVGTSALPAQDLAGGLPVVAAATVTMAAFVAWPRRRWAPTPALVLVVGIPAFLPVTRPVPPPLLLLGIVACCLIVDAALPAAERGPVASGPLPWPVAGVVGGLAFAAILAAVATWPTFAPMLAMYPALLVISLAAVRWSAGPARARQVCRAALGANVAVAMFATVPAALPVLPRTLSLLLAWTGFALVAATWPVLVHAVRAGWAVS